MGGPLPTQDRLDAEHRRASVAALRATTEARPIDLLVVGGGVVGAGSALDAASRGLTVGLIEQRDLAAGTSSRSSRLAHGGLRYLEHREFALVREALAERGLLLDRIAPHLVRPLSFLLPMAGRGWQKPYFGAGVTLYDMLSRTGAYGGTMPRPRTLSKAALRGLAPGLATERLNGAVRFFDAQIDDARHVVALARTAAAHGAAVVTDCRAGAVIRQPVDSEADRVVGARVEVDGESFDVYARCVLSATGVWSDEFRRIAGVAVAGARVRQSKGVHLVVPRGRIKSSSAVIARTPASVLFMLPWGDCWLVGTTDTDYEDGLAEPRAEAEDVDYLLEQANRWLARPLTRGDIVGVYAGLRPLVAEDMAEGGDAATTSLSREHVVLRPLPGLVVVAGGKYTTYRVMARDAVDAAVAERSAFVPGPMPECLTDEIPVIGAAGYSEMWAARLLLAREWHLSEEQVVHLLRRHGDRAHEVAELIAGRPELGQPLHPDAKYPRAEVVIAVTAEGARTVEDVLVRRTRLMVETADAGLAAVPATVELMAEMFRWSSEEKVAERARYESAYPGWRSTVVGEDPF